MQNVLIVGAGTGGSIILDLLQNVDFMKVKAIIDVDENAPGVQLAKDLGVSHGAEWRSWLTEDLHIIFDVTGNSSVFAELLEARPAHTVLVPGSVANLLIQLLQENARHLERIQTEMHRQRMIFDSIEEGMVGINEKGYVDFINKSACKMVGYPIDEALGKPIREVIPSSELPRVFITGRSEVNKELVLANGLKIMTSRFPLYNSEGQKVGAFAVFKDISEVVALAEEITEMRSLIKELESARIIIRKLEATYTFDDIIGHSAEMEISIAQAKVASRSDIPVLLRGESGTGKELYAHAIHSSSKRRFKPFIRVNCASLDPITAEDQLFGQVQPMGVLKSKKSLFEEAEQGTLFIDEVADLSLAIQQKLLHYLTDGMIHRKGDSQPIRLSVRLITATSKNLEKAMSEGTFLEELYYVLNRIAIQIAPLRSRKEDIPSIVSHLLVKLNRELGMNTVQIENAALERLMQYDWPGNVRELENVLGRAMIYMDAGEAIIGQEEVDKSLSSREYKDVEQLLSEKSTLASMMEEHEKEILETALRENKGNKSLTANRLGISLRSLYYKLEKYSLI
ncbi:sigma 54-interacting transcriptional regulator [Sporosarcina soli]|uniref:Sigma 54-interacting transcriptional regulator n=1 Tax=Sporosarcina soli TaxID=334736 RepID=A0ABW0TPV7_9BACL